jgi:hypothetical protein
MININRTVKRAGSHRVNVFSEKRKIIEYWNNPPSQKTTPRVIPQAKRAPRSSPTPMRKFIWFCRETICLSFFSFIAIPPSRWVISGLLLDILYVKLEIVSLS